MKKQFTSWKIAFDLKQLGFNEVCFRYFYTKDIFFDTKVKNSELEEDCSIACPLYQQAFKWLLIQLNLDRSYNNKYSILNDGESYSLFLGGCNMGVFKNETQCVKKLIQIIKKQKL